MILVTGATGTTGSEVVKQLVAAGQSVRALVHDANKGNQLKGPKLEVAVGDFAKPETFAAAMKGCDKMYLVCGVHPEMPKLEGNAIDAAKNAGIKHVVKLSLLGANVEPGIQLGTWHRTAEKKLEASGLSWTFLRPNSFMTNFHMFAPTIKSEGAFYVSAKQGKISVIDPRDIAAVAVKALTTDGHAGKAYDLTGPEGLDYVQVAQKIGAAIGKPVKYVDVPDDAAKKAMVDGGIPAWYADALIGFYGVVKAGYTGGVTPAVEQVTGKKARSFEGWIKENAAAFK